MISLPDRYPLKAHAALLTANIIYGLNYTIAKEAMPQYISPSGFIVIRVIGASLLFWPLSFVMGSSALPARRDLLRLILCAFFGVAVNQLLFFEGLSRTVPINAAIIMTCNPILVLLLAAFILGERLSFLKVTGVITGIGGALMLLLVGKDFSFRSETMKGDILILINASSYAVYLVIVKPLMKNYDVLTIIKWVFLFGAFMVTPIGFSGLEIVQWREMPLHIWAAVAFVVIATTFLAYLLNIYALKNVPSTVVSVYIYLQPVLASVFAIALDRDEMDGIKIISAMIVFSGVYLVSRPEKKN